MWHIALVFTEEGTQGRGYASVMTAAKILHGEVWNSGAWIFLAVYLGYRPKAVPIFALAVYKRICLWGFLRKALSSVSVDRVALKSSVLTHTYLTPWYQHLLQSQCVHPHGSLQILHLLTPILQTGISSIRELKGLIQSTQELFGNQEIPVQPHVLRSQLCLNLYLCHFRNALSDE